MNGKYREECGGRAECGRGVLYEGVEVGVW